MENMFEYIKYRIKLMEFSLPVSFGWIDVVQILLIAISVYYLIIWIRNTRAYTLLKGLLFVFAFLVIASILHMDTILWIVKQISVVAITAVLIIFQPELRRALEQLGEKQIFVKIFENNKEAEDKVADRTVEELLYAVYDMAEVKTGALIVLENNTVLTDYAKTGIAMDSLISSQLLVNIFEEKTPLHDGAVIIRNNRIVAATCYLPLSDNRALNKRFGTRHRAGVGISEVSDALTIIVSEETGKVSYTKDGVIVSGVSKSVLREQLIHLNRNVNGKEESSIKRIWKGISKSEDKTGK